jgi:hypothetical protein
MTTTPPLKWCKALKIMHRILQTSFCIQPLISCARFDDISHHVLMHWKIIKNFKAIKSPTARFVAVVSYSGQLPVANFDIGDQRTSLRGEVSAANFRPQLRTFQYEYSVTSFFSGWVPSWRSCLWLIRYVNHFIHKRTRHICTQRPSEIPHCVFHSVV